MTDLARGERVRWRQGRRWRHGCLLTTRPGVNDTLMVRPDRSAEACTVPTSAVEHETTGPRGGRRWMPVRPTELTATPARRKVRSPEPLAGQLELFDLGGTA